MLPKKYIFALFSIFLILTGCQAQANNDIVNEDAKEIQLAIKNEFSTGEQINEVQREKINKFKEKYIKNINNYRSDEKLLTEMDKLLSGYQMYYVTIGLKDEKGIKMYSDRINEALSELDKQFNK